MEVTYIFHISTWIFFYVLKNSINRTDILLLIFQISTCRLSCHLYTCEGDLRVPSTFLHGIFSIQWKISNRRLDNPLEIFNISTSTLSCHNYSIGCYHPYILCFPMEFFLCVKKFHQENRHPSIDFPRFHIQFIMSNREWWLLSLVNSRFPHGVFSICWKIPPGG